MKIKKLIIKNIGMIADTTIEFNKPLILFYGEICQGKTTILNSVKWAFGGSFPADIIRHGQDEASVILEFEGGSITREWYRAKDGITKVREIAFIRDGKSVKKPVDEIKKFLNPFLLDQDHLRKMTETERTNYFTQLFAVDTTEIDEKILKAESEARDLRAKIKGYGEIDLKEVKLIDAAPIKIEITRIKGNYAAKTREIDIQNRVIIDHNNKVIQTKSDVKEYDQTIKELLEKLADFQALHDHACNWLAENHILPEINRPDPPDTSNLESQISEAAAIQVRYEQYQKNLKRVEEKKGDEKKLYDLEPSQRQL